MAAWPATRGLLRSLGVPISAGPSAADDLPATGLSFHDAEALCARLSARLGVAARLPTEAEWERAARGGFDGAVFPWGDEPISPERCNYAQPRAVPVGCYPPNALGLFDMVGNTQEWTSDHYREDAYARTPAVITDPAGPPASGGTLALRAVRGGLCGAEMCAVMCRSAFRVGLLEDYSGGSIAVRMVLETIPDAPARSA